MIVINTIRSPYFLDLYNLSDMTQNFSEKAIVALGMALLILVRGSTSPLRQSSRSLRSRLVLLRSRRADRRTLRSRDFGRGRLWGVQRLSRDGVRVSFSIVVTIGTMSLYRGIAQVVLGDQAITAYPSRFTDLAQSFIIDQPPLYLAFSLFLTLALVFAVVLHLTAWGRMLYAIGNNLSPRVSREFGSTASASSCLW